MISNIQANKIAHKVLSEYNQKKFDTKDRVIELVKEETSDKEDQVNLFHAVNKAMNKISQGGLS